jgi:hypothetical protein
MQELLVHRPNLRPCEGTTKHRALAHPRCDAEFLRQSTELWAQAIHGRYSEYLLLGFHVPSARRAPSFDGK